MNITFLLVTRVNFLISEKRHSSVDVLKRLKYPPTMLAATRLSAMLNGNDEVYANSMVVDEVRFGYIGKNFQTYDLL